MVDALQFFEENGEVCPADWHSRRIDPPSELALNEVKGELGGNIFSNG
jgi:alkyl hydroperoxide reductase subunit AhpC